MSLVSILRGLTGTVSVCVCRRHLNFHAKEYHMSQRSLMVEQINMTRGKLHSVWIELRCAEIDLHEVRQLALAEVSQRAGTVTVVTCDRSCCPGTLCFAGFACPSFRVVKGELLTPCEAEPRIQCVPRLEPRNECFSAFQGGNRRTSVLPLIMDASSRSPLATVPVPSGSCVSRRVQVATEESLT